MSIDCECFGWGLGRKLLIDFPAARRRLTEHSWEENSLNENIIYICVCVFLVIGSGLMSGLTLGLLSLDHLEMEVLKRSGSPDQKRNATKLMPVIKVRFWNDNEMADDSPAMAPCITRLGCIKDKSRWIYVINHSFFASLFCILVLHPCFTSLLQDTHFLLVTLLLCNAACMETLPIFLDRVRSSRLDMLDLLGQGTHLIAYRQSFIMK